MAELVKVAVVLQTYANGGMSDWVHTPCTLRHCEQNKDHSRVCGLDKAAQQSVV